MLALPQDCLSLTSEAGAHVQLACAVVKRMAESREVTRHLSVSTRLCSDSGDDEIEHSVDPIRVGRMFVHHDDSVDESYHVDKIDIRSDLSCGLGAEQQNISRLEHSSLCSIDLRSPREISA